MYSHSMSFQRIILSKCTMCSVISAMLELTVAKFVYQNYSSFTQHILFGCHFGLRDRLPDVRSRLGFTDLPTPSEAGLFSSRRRRFTACPIGWPRSLVTGGAPVYRLAGDEYPFFEQNERPPKIRCVPGITHGLLFSKCCKRKIDL